MLYEGGIAFFDSGIGGLTTFSECISCTQKLFPNSPLPDFYYYGDNFRAPYGNLPKTKIREYVLEAFSVFEKLKVGAVVLACNTATAVCIDELRKKYAFPILGIEPAVAFASKKGGNIFVLSTSATYHSERFQNLCNLVSLKYPDAKIQAFACADLAGEIERRLGDERFDYSKFLPKGNPDTVVLGCTHYVYIKKFVSSFYGAEVLDGNAGVAKRLCSILEEQNLKKYPPSQKFLKSEDFRKRKELSLEKSFLEGILPFTDFKMVETPKIFFIGNGKVVNKHIYEQMFGG